MSRYQQTTIVNAICPRVKVSTPQGLPASAADHIAEVDPFLADAKSIPGSKQMTALRIPKNSPNQKFFGFLML